MAATDIPIRIDTATVKHKMAGGIGAAWHAIGPEPYWYQDLLRTHYKRNRNGRGSGYGGNPPLDYKEAWEGILTHARWLGFNFIRLEIDMRMYEPARGVFDWENEEMRTLYRILDHCEKEGVDVFFQQMWQDVEWNAIEGAGRLQSAPKSVPDFAEGVATLMERLIQHNGYGCIRWLCISNEPGYRGRWWQGGDGGPASVMPALRALRAALDARNIGIPISGPDWAGMADLDHLTDFDFEDAAIGALDAHNYSGTPNFELQKKWVERAHGRGIPFFQTEFGHWTEELLGDPCHIPVREYPAQLLNARKVIGGLNAGVDAFCRWSFTNRGDLDGQWQMVRTWDAVKWDYFPRVTPEPVPYYAYGIVSRFMAKYSEVLETELDSTEVISAAIRSPKGNLSVYAANNSGNTQRMSITFAGLGKGERLYKYQVTEMALRDASYAMNPLLEIEVSANSPEIADALPAKSITAYSTYHLKQGDAGVIAD